MIIHSEEEKKEKLELIEKVYLTEEAYVLLREQKEKQDISMAKIVCNLIIEKYGKKKVFGNPFINEMHELLKKEAGLPTLSGTIKENRNYCNLAIRKWNKETVEGIIKVGTRLKFHKNNLTGFKYLYYNGEKMIKAYQDQKSENKINIINLNV